MVVMMVTAASMTMLFSVFLTIIMTIVTTASAALSTVLFRLLNGDSNLLSANLAIFRTHLEEGFTDVILSIKVV